MILNLEQSQVLCEWLAERGVDLRESVYVLSDLECGDTFALSLLKMFRQRDLRLDKINEKNKMPIWDEPITP